MPNAIPLGLHLVIQLLREGPDPDGLVLLIDASGNCEIELQAADLLREKILGPLFIVREDLRLDLGADHLHQFAQLASLCGLVELALRDLYGDLHAALPASLTAKRSEHVREMRRQDPRKEHMGHENSQ